MIRKRLFRSLRTLEHHRRAGKKKLEIISFPQKSSLQRTVGLKPENTASLRIRNIHRQNMIRQFYRIRPIGLFRQIWNLQRNLIATTGLFDMILQTQAHILQIGIPIPLTRYILCTQRQRNE